MEWDKEKIKALRNLLKLTQTQLAELLGTSYVLISYWETGRRRPSGISKKALTSLAEVKGVKKEELVWAKETKSSPQKTKKKSFWNKESIKAFRERLGSSKTQFALELGRSHSLISRWEKGERNPSRRTQQLLNNLAEESGVDLEEIRRE